MTELEQQVVAAVAALRRGGVIAYPTESVFGLGCDPDVDEAVQRILTLKQRPAEKGLILVAAEYHQLERYLLPLPDQVRERVFATWPGPHTWLCPVREGVSPLLRGQHPTLAVRISAHPVVRQLCQHFGKAIVSTSANPASLAPARSADEVREYFPSNLDCIIDAQTGQAAQPTEIRDAISNRVIRPS